MKSNSYLLEFEVDKLTDSILNRVNGVSFESKTKLIEHYESTLGATNFSGRLMVIDSIAAKLLVDKYFKP